MEEREGGCGGKWRQKGGRWKGGGAREGEV